MTHTISIDAKAIRGVEFHGFQRGSVEVDLTPAQLHEAFETIYQAAPAATKESMRAFIAEHEGVHA